MRSEQEIRAEIASLHEMASEYEEQATSRELDMGMSQRLLIEIRARLEALKWVLGES